MRILICDDDKLIQQELIKYLNDFFQLHSTVRPEIIAYDSGEATINDGGEKDIIFLDIEMPGVSGIFTGRELKRQNPNVIIFIITSYSEYLDEAMRINVFRYFTKPIDRLRLFRNMKDAMFVYSNFSTIIPIETKNGVSSVQSSDIIFVETIKKKVLIHTLSANYESIHNIQYWDELLNKNSFFRSHRSFIINMNYVSSFDHTLIYLCNKQYSAYLTRRKYTDFKKQYFRFIDSRQYNEEN